MDERLHSLLAALPQLPERSDGTFEQITDLVQIAEKLGMSGAAELLNEKLDFSRKCGLTKFIDTTHKLLTQDKS